jgi:hypothetical protein
MGIQSYEKMANSHPRLHQRRSESKTINPPYATFSTSNVHISKTYPSQPLTGEGWDGGEEDAIS